MEKALRSSTAGTRLQLVRAWWTILLLVLAASSAAAPAGPALRIGVAQALPFHDLRVMSEWAQYLERKLGRPIHLVRRRSHTEIVDLLIRQRLDIAWVCPDHYRRHKDRVSLLAGPVFQGRQEFQLLVLAPAHGLPELQGLLDLRGKVIAFAEPDTNLGSVLVKRAVGALGPDPEHFFRRVIYTGDHERVIRAVAGGIAHAGAVMDQSWEVVQAADPGLAAGLRVLWRSGWRPLPPLVGSASLRPSDAAAFREALTSMPEDPQGRAVLAGLHFERFVTPDPNLYRAGSGGSEPAACGE
jgi:phosphonate transport system substrate-binding protein